MPEHDDEIDRLYGLDLDQFTSERNALVKRLRKGGEREAADAVASLRKPTVAAWAVNRLARDRRKDVDLLLDAGHRLRAAQQELLESGDRSELDRAREAERKALDRLTAEARTLLGGRPSAAVLEQVVETLRTAAVTDAGRELLARGQLTTALEPTGFDAVAGMSPRRGALRRPLRQTAATRPKPKPGPDPAQVREAERELRDARARLRQAERELERARAAVGAAEERLKGLRRR